MAQQKAGGGTMKIWTCKIGEVPEGVLPDGADRPMRDAVARMYVALTGEENIFLFSGWGGQLTEGERAVVENREPRPSAEVEVARLQAALQNIALLKSVPQRSATTDQRLDAAVNLANAALYPEGMSV